VIVILVKQILPLARPQGVRGGVGRAQLWKEGEVGGAGCEWWRGVGGGVRGGGRGGNMSGPGGW